MCSFLFGFQLRYIMYNVSFELIRKLTVKQRAHKKIDYNTKYFSLTRRVGCTHKETKCIDSDGK